jgi:hypothetical protein
MDVPIRTISLENSLTICVFDQTRRYYEDFHLVKLEIICEVPLRSEFFIAEGDFSAAKKLLGETATYRRTVEQMGVPSNEIESVRKRMVENFERNSLPYFAVADFPQKLVISEFTKARKKLGLPAV